jgi:hypothetical protein
MTMAEIRKRSGRRQAFLRWLVAAAFVFAIVFSGFFAGLMNRAGLLFLLFGSVATAFMGFSRQEIAAAFRNAAGLSGPVGSLRRAAHFWEAAARNAWILGVLGSAINFAIALGGESGGIADISNRMIQSFVVTLYGLVLSVICLVPAMKIAGELEKAKSLIDPPADEASRPAPARAFSFERLASYVSFTAVLVLTALPQVQGYPQKGTMPIGKVMLHGPAILVVFGGAIALALFMGSGTGARAWTLGFATTGLIALLLGLIQALFGFVHTSLQEISAALAFIIAASTFALLGLVAVAAPLEDREIMEGRREGPWPLSRMFWVIFPLLAFIFLLLTFILVITPITKPGGG